VNCAKTAEPIEMQFGILSPVGPENMSYMHGDVDAPREGPFWGVWPILKHCNA